jgi:hypothetical protein
MKVKIVASRHKERNVVSLEDYIGQEFDAYYLGNDVVIRNPAGYNMIVYDGEFEVIE